MNKLILFLFMCLISFNAYSADLQGIGYGSTMEEAKQEALSDLSASVKVQVYSKHEQTTYKNKNKIKNFTLREDNMKRGELRQVEYKLSLSEIFDVKQYTYGVIECK